MLKKKRPIQEIAPWLTFITPSLVLGKDGIVFVVLRASRAAR